jgi:hypothetical protein
MRTRCFAVALAASALRNRRVKSSWALSPANFTSSLSLWVDRLRLNYETIEVSKKRLTRYTNVVVEHVRNYNTQSIVTIGKEGLADATPTCGTRPPT